MRPISPDIGALEHHMQSDGVTREATAAELLDADGTTHLFVFRWTFNEEERRRIFMNREDVYLTFVGFTVPHKIECGKQPWMQT